MVRRFIPQVIKKALKNFLNNIAAVYTRQTPIQETSVHDIFIIGYPKSGNTWLQNIIAELVYGVEVNKIDDALLQDLMPDVHFKRTYRRYGKRMYFKSHDLPKPHHRKVIYIVRDGRDVMVSYFNYLNALGESDTDLNAQIQSGKGFFPCKWHEHVRAWKDNPFGAEILFIRYEDLLDKTFESISLLTHFLGLDISDDAVNAVIKNTSFNQMQQKERNSGWDYDRNWPKDRLFVRKGKAGSYRDEMSVDTENVFMVESEREMIDYGYVRKPQKCL